MSGSWTLDRAIKARWDQKGLDAKFRAYWPAPAETRWTPWNDGEARAGARMPYAVYEKGVAVKTGESTSVPGDGGRIAEYWMYPISFRIHAATVSGPPILSGKEVAGRLAREIVLAYEDDAGAMSMDDDDCHIQTVVGPDFHVREEDDVWAWVVQLEVHVERRRSLRGVA